MHVATEHNLIAMGTWIPKRDGWVSSPLLTGSALDKPSAPLLGYLLIVHLLPPTTGDKPVRSPRSVRIPVPGRTFATPQAGRSQLRPK